MPGTENQTTKEERPDTTVVAAPPRASGVPIHRFVYVITGTLTVLSFSSAAAALSWPTAQPVGAGLGLATAAHVAGFLLALILFVDVDSSLRNIRTAVLGAISGTGLVKAEAMARFAAKQFDALGTADGGPTAALFFIALGAGLLGIVGGFTAVRLGLEREIVERRATADDTEPEKAVTTPGGTAMPTAEVPLQGAPAPSALPQSTTSRSASP